jgi:hypothetical protein
MRAFVTHGTESSPFEVSGKSRKEKTECAEISSHAIGPRTWEHRIYEVHKLICINHRIAWLTVAKSDRYVRRTIPCSGKWQYGIHQRWHVKHYTELCYGLHTERWPQQHQLTQSALRYSYVHWNMFTASLDAVINRLGNTRLSIHVL